MKIRYKLMLINLLVGLLAAVMMAVILINAFARTSQKNLQAYDELETSLEKLAYDEALSENLKSTGEIVSKQTNVADALIDSAILKSQDIISHYAGDGDVTDEIKEKIYMDLSTAQGYFSDHQELYDKILTRLEKAQLDSEGRSFFVVSESRVFPESVMSDLMDEEIWVKNVANIYNGDSGNIETTMDDKPVFVVYQKMKTTGWKYCSIISKSEIGRLGEVLQAEFQETEGELVETSRKNYIELILYAFIIIFIMIIIVIILSYLGSGYFTKPIIELLEGVKSTEGGNLDKRLEITSDDEIGELTAAYNEMLEHLTRYIEDVKLLAGEKERVQAEMSMAADIQNGMLPSEPMKEDSFHASGFMRPAKSVGGDFYDFFRIDDEHTAFLIADVSDKGIPAALYMAIGRTIIREIALNGSSLDKVFGSANNVLTRNNDNCQFITAFAAVLNKNTGEMSYVNAGHEPPMIIRGDRTVETMDIKPGFVLGIMEDVEYETGTIKLDAGDKLFMYTDGVIDSVNEAEERFNTEGIIRFLSEYTAEKNSEEEIEDFVKEIDEYSKNMNQADDITMLLLEYKG